MPRLVGEILHAGQVLLIPVFILFNAFFVAAEFALVTVRRTRLEEIQSKKRSAGVALALVATGRIDQMIAATQMGITMTSLALGWIGEPGLARLMEPWFRFLPAAWGPVAAHTAATLVAFACITFLHVVVGELAPKTVAIRVPDVVAIRLAGPLLAFERVGRPFIRLTSLAGRSLVRVMGFAPAKHEAVHTVEELQLLVEDVSEAGRMSAEHAELLKNAFRLPVKRAGDAMVPLANVSMLDVRWTPERIIEAVQDSVHTRFPVYEGDRTRIVGIVNAKDLFYLYTTSGLVQVADAMYPPTWTPADRSIADQLKEFRRIRRQMAIVVDAVGQPIGAITLEDIIEELVGEIEDEHDVRGVREAVEAAVATRAAPREGRRWGWRPKGSGGDAGAGR
jgi:CBS domain containing-hemolysin-like protein